MHPSPLLLIFASLILPVQAAKPTSAPPPAPSANVVYTIPGLVESLQARGWRPTPEQSSGIQVGDIRHVRDPGRFLGDCFPGAVPRTGSQVDASIVQKLKAGGSVRLGVARASADGFQYKQSTIAEPYTEEYDERALKKLSEECRAILKGEAADWMVVTAVLSAQVVERLCRSLEGGVRVPGASATAGGAEECVAESDGHVAIAYRTRSMAELMGAGAAEPPAKGGAALPTQPAPVVRGSEGAFVADLDVSQALAEQQCAEEAQGKAAAALQARMSGEVGKKQTEASAAWKALSPQAEHCLQLKDVASRKPCIEKVGQFVVWAGGLKVEAKAGFESVPTACGARSVPIAAQVMAVPVAEVAQASAMLLRLQEQGGQVQAASGKDYTANGSTMKWLAPGSFTMGCTAGQGSACESDEKPSHQVSLSGFWMASVETTQRQWTAVTGSRHSSYSSSCGEDCPVVNINWCEALSFANARSKKEGLKPAYTLPWSGAAPTGEACDTASPTVQWDRSADGYRLPTEAEWEYAARAGKDTLYAGGAELNALGWYDKNSGGGVHPVGQKAANAWGLYDMSGNVWEWAWDWVGPYTASNAANPSGPTSGVGRVNRGGSFRNEATRMRVANRNRNNPQRANDNQGFRLCLGLTDRGLPGAPAPQPAVARAYPEQAPLRVALPAPSPTCSRRPGRASGWAPFSCCAPDARIVRRGAACGGREAATVAPGQRPHPKLSPSTEGGGPSGAPQATAAP